MIKALMKNRLASVLYGSVARSRKGGVQKASRGKIVAFAILYLYLFIFFAGFSVFLSTALASVFIPAGASWAYFAIFILASVSVLFVLSIFETKSELFECKDNELLLSMPIKPRDIVLARISVVLLYNYIIQAVVMLPCIVVYAIFSRDPVGTVGITLISIFLPLLSTALASGVGYLVALIGKKLRKNSFVTVGMALIFLLAYFFGYSYLMDGFDTLVAGGPDGVTMTPEKAPLLYAIGSAASFNPLSFTLIILLSLAAAAIAFAVIARSYIKVVTDNRGVKRAEYKGEKLSQSSVLLALSKKEFQRFTSSATYMLNAGLGIVFELIVGVLALVKSRDLMSFLTELTAESGVAPADLICPLMLSAIFMLSSMNMISASALSLEGKNLWIIKSLPLKERDVLIAKTIPHTVICSAASFITALCFMIAVSAPVRYWPFFILTPLAANIFSSVFGLVINVRFPKFNYENEAQPVKQSLPVFIVMTVQMLLGLAVIFLNFILALLNLGLLAAILTLLLFVILAVISIALLFGISVKKYREINP